ncbi:diphosphomevalonate decarboxylase [Erysipelothrix larvae]|uniref:diphosphomevalonate decarboxylase n=1 Tax=Erysipelothrix larvae TaxID=1514105 RepID=A0A0X8GYE8_9FIRM|nr:diphosphomevalonate decarboxylase [Erysipelothrix larvae]AMC92734.1 diphosphomevalonate decarboxylase [Erysipelothrix larvae]
MSKRVRAHTNIALIKYWGKKDKDLRLPYNSSLSLTLDGFYTETSVTYDDSLDHDVFYLDGVYQDQEEAQRVFSFMRFLRSRYDLPQKAKIESWNHVPMAAGLASSASAFAALAKAATLDLDLDDTTLTRLARMGSGSASRSIYGGFVKWEQGDDDQTSIAHPIDMNPWDDIRMIVCVLNSKQKRFSSSMAMDKTVEESVYYEGWVRQSERDLVNLENALKAHDIHTVGKISQENALRMHASLMAVGLWYFEPETLDIMNRIRDLQDSIPVYFTMDAGPNVKLITTQEYVDDVLKVLNGIEVHISKPGPGAYVV